MMGILSQCIHVSNHHVVYFKYTIIFVNYISLKLKNVTRRKLIREGGEMASGDQGGLRKRPSFTWALKEKCNFYKLRRKREGH